MEDSLTDQACRFSTFATLNALFASSTSCALTTSSLTSLLLLLPPSLLSSVAVVSSRSIAMMGCSENLAPQARTTASVT